MVCRSTFIKNRARCRLLDLAPRGRVAFTTVELLVTMCVTAICLLALMALAMHFARSIGLLENYVDLDMQSRMAFDRMSREIRQADRVESAWTNGISLQVAGQLVSYTFDPAARTFSRICNGKKEPYLKDCNYVRFDLFQRNAINGTYDYYPAADPASCKVVQVTWICSRKLVTLSSTETMQSGQVVLRKQRL